MLATPAHVFIIDDNEDILFMLKAMLQLKKYRVSIKENVDGLEATLTNLLPDVILMDMLLSGKDGREICKGLKANAALAKIPVIMMSAHPHAKTECLKAGADYFLEKPFEMNDIFQVVNNALQ